MKDKLISFETAMLAKEKGFDEACDIHYRPSDGEIVKDKGTKNSEWNHLYTLPTQSLLQRWLREKHRIAVEPNIGSHGKYVAQLVNDYTVTHKGSGNFDYFTNHKILSNDFAGFDTYELALEHGLQEALKLIP